MNAKMSKKIRKTVNRKVVTDMEELAKTLSKAPLYWRIVYAFRLVFRWHPEVRFERDHGKRGTDSAQAPPEIERRQG